MALHVIFLRSGFRGDGSSHPRVVRQHITGLKSLLHLMAKDTAIEQADMRTMLDRLADALVFFLSLGDRVRTPIGTFALGVKRGRSARGKKRPDQVNAEWLHVRFLPSRALMDRLRAGTEIVVDRENSPPPPVVDRIVDVEGGPGLEAVRPGGLLALRGARFSLDPRDAETGVFFVPEDGGEGAPGGSYAVYRASVYSRTGSARIDCKVPDLPDGRYKVQVRTRPTGRAVHTGTAADRLTVAAGADAAG